MGVLLTILGIIAGVLFFTGFKVVGLMIIITIAAKLFSDN